MSRKHKNGLTRKNADKHLLYQWSVQSPEFEVEFMEQIYRRRRGAKPRIFREDFCGTALNACHWVQEDPARRAIGLDLDRPTLNWALKHNVAPLGEAARRVDLRLQDVRRVTRPRADVACAFNFSYYLFTRLQGLTEYFQRVRRSLAPGGVFFLDTYGGWESQQCKVEPRRVKSPQGSFTYIWDQASYNPIDNMTRCYIHFKFRNGERWDRAFTYHWRLYTPAEVKDALLAAGFKNVTVYWDVAEEEDDSEYRPRRRGENQPGWLAYIVADA